MTNSTEPGRDIRRCSLELLESYSPESRSFLVDGIPGLSSGWWQYGKEKPSRNDIANGATVFGTALGTFGARIVQFAAKILF